MNEPRKVVFYSARQEDAQQKFLEKQRRRAEFSKDMSIVMSIILMLILFTAFSVLLGLLHTAVPTLIAAL
jgi:hypothetical protein